LYTLRQTDINISQVETNNLQISHYASYPKYLSIYNKGEINLQYVEVEIRNADTGKYAEEIIDCTLEVLIK
jgi:hypothetical protein